MNMELRGLRGSWRPFSQHMTQWIADDVTTVCSMLWCPAGVNNIASVNNIAGDVTTVW